MDNQEIGLYKPNNNEIMTIGSVIEKAEASAAYEFEKESIDIIEYNKKKMDNWVTNQELLLQIELAEKANEIKMMKEHLSTITNFLEKVDYREKIEKKERELEKEQTKYYQKMDAIKTSAERSIKEFNQKYYKKASLIVRIVVKF